MTTLEPRKLSVSHLKSLLESQPPLTYLAFGKPFNEALPALPSTLKTLTFNADFNKKIENLPESLLHLSFGKSFNRPLGSLFPSSLVHLSFGASFNQMVDHLPPSWAPALRWPQQAVRAVGVRTVHGWNDAMTL